MVEMGLTPHDVLFSTPTYCLPPPAYSVRLTTTYDLPQVRKVNKGTECGVILSDTTDLAKGDVLTCYEVVQRKVGLYDSVSEEGADQQKRTTSDDDDDDDS